MAQLQFETQLTLKDGISFAFYNHYKKSSSLVALLICFLAIVYFLLMFNHEPHKFSDLYTAVGFTALYLLIPSLVYLKTKRFFLSDKKFSFPVHWIMDENHVEMKNEIFEYQFLWSSISSVVESRNFFAIYHNHISANVIPKNRLTPETVVEFRKLMISIPNLATELWINPQDSSAPPLRLATRSRRILNGLLDTFFYLLFFSALTLLYLVIYVKLTPNETETSPIVRMIPYIAVLPLYGLYYFITEFFFQRSPAKWITRTKVVGINSTRPSAKQILGRTLSRMIPFEFISFLVTPEGVHDLLSKTKVIQN